MTSKKNILLLTPSKIGLTETFINAHKDQLNGNVFYLYGWDLDFKTEADITLKELYADKPWIFSKLKTLLPHFVYFRLQKKQKALQTKEALIKRYIKENKIDLVFAEYGTSGSFITPICKFLQIPLIVHFHGIDASKYSVLQEFENGYQAMFRYAASIIAVSNAMKQALIDLGCESSKITVTVCGPHQDYLSLTPNYTSNHVVAVGRHTYKKAPYLTILAFQKVLQSHPELKLTLIGTGALFEVSQRLVQSLGLEDAIHLPGGLKREEIVPYLEKSFLFVQHSLVALNGDSEGTPVGVIEAMAAGLPVVSTRHAGIPDVVIVNKTGFLVDEGDIDAMAEYIIQIAEDRTLAKCLGSQSRDRILEHYTMEHHIETLNKLL
jgi:colanic acid/amylovoran biosynthesis glycosyltransferase